MDVVSPGGLHPAAEIVCAKADRTTTAVGTAVMLLAKMFPLRQPCSSLVRGTRPGCHDFEAPPA
eukprot:12703027-Alexandrium_andersonii.AAC.1